MTDLRPAQTDPPCLSDVARIWLGLSAPAPQTRLFRRRVDTGEPLRSVRMTVFADTVFHLWVNGQYVQRGPALHHPHRPHAMTLDLTPFWREGQNVLAAAVLARGIATHNYVPTGEPGLVARVTLEAADGIVRRVETDEAWRATDQTGWRSDVPRRGWALGHIEVFDAARAPTGWQGRDFDDSSWTAAEAFRPATRIDEAQWRHSDLPLLRLNWTAAREIIGFHETPAAEHEPGAEDNSAEYGSFLLSLPWRAPEAISLDGKPDDTGGGFTVSGLSGEVGAVVIADLGRQYTGQVIVECECDSAGTLDIAWAERFLGDRPAVMLKGTTYADCVQAEAGPLHWEPLNFSSGRYLMIALRGFEGSVRFTRLGMRASEPDLSWAGWFECSDPRLNEIWRMCELTVRVGTQECVMDCPTREQAAYLGDGHPVARWIGLLTGDWTHWKYLLREAFGRITSEGLIRTSVFTGMKRSLIDYVLLTVVGARDYFRHTGDLETLREILPGCRRVFDWFDAARDENGLMHIGLGEGLAHNAWERQYDPEGWDDVWDKLPFIDHPGLGWHGPGEPGIDRRGINAAMNALYVVARRALAEIEEALGTDGADASRREADRTAAAARRAFWAESEKAFADGLLDGERLPQISQQTNIWCLWAGLCDVAEADAVVGRILREDDPRLARCGPYFWSYLLPLLARHDLHAHALDEIRRLWGPMLDAGATTLWETFAGDELDTWCHPWSAAPLEFLLTGVLGLDPLSLRGPKPVLRPRTDLLARAEGRIFLPEGEAKLSWDTDSRGRARLAGRLPKGITATLQSPDGRDLTKVEGLWSYGGNG